MSTSVLTVSIKLFCSADVSSQYGLLQAFLPLLVRTLSSPQLLNARASYVVLNAPCLGLPLLGPRRVLKRPVGGRNPQTTKLIAARQSTRVAVAQFTVMCSYLASEVGDFLSTFER